MQSMKTIVTQQRIIYAIAIVLSHVGISSAAVSNCGGVLRGETGTFTSPNYPFPQSSTDPNSKESIECTWEIVVPAGYGIHLNFGDFRMAAGPDQCEKGMIEVFKGVGENKQFQDRYCGSDEINIINLKVNSATVSFRRPENFEGNGFLISYIATRPPNHVNDFVTCVDKGMKHVGVEEFSVICPGGCANLTGMDAFGSSNKYRDDSHLCKAAVHAGVISDKHGGRIYVQRKPGIQVYYAEFANGIMSKGASMSDILFSFSNFGECNSRFDVTKDEISASSVWLEHDENDNKTYTWSSDKALVDALLAWSPLDPMTEQWLQVDFKQRKNITAIVTDGDKSRKYFMTRSYQIQYSDDGKTWTKYKEEGNDEPKVFIGNQQYFQTSRHNFIRPSIVARYLRVYPTPAKRNGRGGYTRYAIKVSLFGCDLTPLIASSTPTDTTLLTTNSPPPLVPVVTDKPVPTLNETSIIVIGIVAALAVTSILLASCVLILVRKRKKNMKTVKGNGPADRLHLNNNNLGGQYLNGFERKKRKSRNKSEQQQIPPSSNETIEIQNINYKDTIINAGFGSTPTTTLLQSHNGGFPNGNGLGDHGDMERVDSDGYHDYHFISDEQVAPPSVHSNRTGSSKHSTGSSIHSRKSDTMQRVWGDQVTRAPTHAVTRSPVFDTNTPTFPLHHSFSQPAAPPVMSTFVPRLPKSNPPRRTHSQSPHHMSSSSNEYAPENNFPRKHSLGSRPYYTTSNDDGNYGNGHPPSSYQYPNPNAPPLHHIDGNIDPHQQKSRSESIRAAKQRQGYDRLYRNNSSPTGDKYYPSDRKLSLRTEEDDSMNSYDKLDLP